MPATTRMWSNTDCPAIGTVFPATGTGSPATETSSPATGTGSPATGTGSPATGTGSPATGTGSSATGTGSSSTRTVYPSACNHEDGPEPDRTYKSFTKNPDKQLPSSITARVPIKPGIIKKNSSQYTIGSSNVGALIKISSAMKSRTSIDFPKFSLLTATFTKCAMPSEVVLTSVSRPKMQSKQPVKLVKLISAKDKPQSDAAKQKEVINPVLQGKTVKVKVHDDNAVKTSCRTYGSSLLTTSSASNPLAVLIIGPSSTYMKTFSNNTVTFPSIITTSCQSSSSTQDSFCSSQVERDKVNPVMQNDLLSHPKISRTHFVSDSTQLGSTPIRPMMASSSLTSPCLAVVKTVAKTGKNAVVTPSESNQTSKLFYCKPNIGAPLFRMPSILSNNLFGNKACSAEKPTSHIDCAKKTVECDLISTGDKAMSFPNGTSRPENAILKLWDSPVVYDDIFYPNKHAESSDQASLLLKDCAPKKHAENGNHVSPSLKDDVLSEVPTSSKCGTEQKQVSSQAESSVTICSQSSVLPTAIEGKEILSQLICEQSGKVCRSSEDLMYSKPTSKKTILQKNLPNPHTIVSHQTTQLATTTSETAKSTKALSFRYVWAGNDIFFARGYRVPVRELQTQSFKLSPQGKVCPIPVLKAPPIRSSASFRIVELTSAEVPGFVKMFKS